MQGQRAGWGERDRCTKLRRGEGLILFAAAMGPDLQQDLIVEMLHERGWYGGRHDHRDHGGVRTDPLGLRAPQGAPDRRWDAHGPPEEPVEDARRVAQTLPKKARFESKRRVENALRTYEIG